MKILRTLSECSSWRSSLTQNKKIGFVPTMGALHAGHAKLLKVARERCEIAALSIFVNPLQFGANEDLSKYPKTLERDLALAEENGVDAVLLPDPGEMYPPGFSTNVEETKVSEPLCGKFRPGHFRGVATVVFKLFQWIDAHEAFFGLKDAQQYFVIRKMALDLSLKTQVYGVPTVRDSDGLAMSSRNRYLSVEERKLAPLFSKSLEKIALNVSKEALKASEQELAQAGFDVQYLDIRSIPDLKPYQWNEETHSGLLIAGAVFLGKTRLIDNQIIRIKDPASNGLLL